MFRSGALLLLLLLLLLSAMPRQAAENVLRLHGSNTIGEKLAPVLAEKWLKSKGYTQVTIRETGPVKREVVGRNAEGRQFTVEVIAHGSSTAFTDLASGGTDIGMASRPIKAKEVSDLMPLGMLDHVRGEFVIGLDGVAVIVNARPPRSRAGTCAT